MEVINPVCCGADVHKNTIVATIAATAPGGRVKYLRGAFGTLASGLSKFRDWLLDNGCRDVCMESTGVYWIPIFNVLEAAGIRVCLTHPKYVRAIKGKKCDKKDSKWIADLYRCDLVRSSFIPPVDFRAARQVGRYRFKLVCMRSSERNRYQNGMTVSNIQLSSVLSDPFGRTAQEIMDLVLSPSGADPEECRRHIYGRARSKAEEILDSVADVRLTDEQRFKMSECKAHIAYLDGAVRRTEGELRRILGPHRPAVRLLETIPGVTELSAMLILAEVGDDMAPFEDAGHLCSWAGLAPGLNESADKKKSTRVTRAGAYLKPLLVQCAQAAVRCEYDTYFAERFARIKGRRGYKKAIVAVARMMLTCVYHMLSTGEVFDPDRGRRTPREEAAPASPATDGLTNEELVAALEARGYTVVGRRAAGG